MHNDQSPTLVVRPVESTRRAKSARALFLVVFWLFSMSWLTAPTTGDTGLGLWAIPAGTLLAGPPAVLLLVYDRMHTRNGSLIAQDRRLIITTWRGKRRVITVSGIALVSVPLMSAGSSPVALFLILVAGNPGEGTVALIPSAWPETDLAQVIMHFGITPQELGNVPARKLRRRYQSIRPHWIVHQVVFGLLATGVGILWLLLLLLPFVLLSEK